MYEHVEFEEVKRDDTLVVEVGGSKQVTLNLSSEKYEIKLYEAACLSKP